MSGSTPERVTFRHVFASREFRALWLAQILSMAGDQLARVALSVLVFERTRSALLTAATYAVTYLPWVIGALGLSGLGDHVPRRRMMLTCDVARAVLVVVMALPGAPLWALVILLFMVTLLEPPFEAARAAIFADVLRGESYVLGTAVARTTNQAGMVTGFALGGVIVALLGSRPALALDAVTFIVSALLILLWVRPRPSASTTGTATGRSESLTSTALAGVRLVFRDPQLRTLALFGWLAAFYAVPEGLAVPYATDLGGGPVAVGLILAAMPLGTSLGSVAYSRFVPPSRRLRWMGPLALGSCAALIPLALGFGLSVSLALLATSGVFSAYQLAANATFVRAVPDDRRSQAFGVVQAGFAIGHGLTIVLAGWAAEHMAPAAVIGISGALGTVAAIPLTRPRHHSRIVMAHG